LKNVGKGWYNINEKNVEVYNISKLKNFMTTIKFVMQDTIRSLIMNSFYEYLNMLKSTIGYNIIIESPNSVKYNERNLEDPHYINISNGLNKKPIFVLDLIFKDGKIIYDMDKTSYINTTTSLIDKALTAFDNLGDLEPYVLDQLFWATKPLLETVKENDPFVVSIKESVRSVMEEAIRPINDFLSQFNQYSELAKLDPAQFMLQYEEKDLSIDEMERDIKRYQKELEVLEKEIPNNAYLGMFWVNCESIRNVLRKDFQK